MAKAPLVTDIQLIAVYVTDFDRALAFYTGVLGFTQETDVPPTVILRSGAAMLYLESGRREPAAETGAHPHVSAVFGTRSVATAYEALKEQGVPIVYEYEQFSDDFAFFRFADPDGNVHEFGGKP